MNTERFQLKFKHQLLILVFLAFAINANTLFHEYVLDDVIVLTENKFVKKGLQGIPELLSQSYFKGYEKLENLEFSGGRYRPIALISFAIEYQFFGANPIISHLINVLLYTIVVALLFGLLYRYVFREQHKLLAFVACLVFVVHPIHTEVIANVKSRDELITFILVLVALIFFIRHFNYRNLSQMMIGLVCFFLALLTRESSITLIGVVPVILYYFYNQSLKRAIQYIIPMIAVLVVYLLIRFSIVDNNSHFITDITNSPFLNASPYQAFATKIFLLVKYMWLLIFPYSLSFEYGYNQIPYIDFLSFKFIFSILIVFSLIGLIIVQFKKKSIFSFSILYFFITISLVSNFVIDIGTPLSERLLFQPSLAFCIIVGSFYCINLKRYRMASNSVLISVLLLFTIKTISRNMDWKNYETLVLTDVKTAPNSVRINQFAMNIFLSKSNQENNQEKKNEYLKEGALYGEQMLKICPDVVDVYTNLGYVYYNLNNYEKAAELWLKGCEVLAKKEDASKSAEIFSNELYRLGNGFSEKNKIKDAIVCYRKSTELNPANTEAWYNLGGHYLLLNDSLHGNKAWHNVMKLSPNHILRIDDFKND